MSELVLGIDTSNYKTSVALIDSSFSVLQDRRRFLQVKKGSLGLRQQEALFQHVQALPGLIEQALKGAERAEIRAVAASSRPRPVEGSYMPVFLAGVSAAKSVATALGAEYFEFSHQEGHVEAARSTTDIPRGAVFHCYHLSGGTTEALLCGPEGFELIGGSRDISLGQLIDRAGLRAGLSFPAGGGLDRLAMKFIKSGRRPTAGLPRPKIHDGRIALSGLENKLEDLNGAGIDAEEAAYLIFDMAADVLLGMAKGFTDTDGCPVHLFAGGVSSSAALRLLMAERCPEGLSLRFGSPELCSDNAVGTALLGGGCIWLQSR